MSYSVFYANSGCKDRPIAERYKRSAFESKFEVPFDKFNVYLKASDAIGPYLLSFETEEDAYWFFREGYKDFCYVESDGTRIDPYWAELEVDGELRGQRQCAVWPFWPKRISALGEAFAKQPETSPLRVYEPLDAADEEQVRAEQE